MPVSPLNVSDLPSNASAAAVDSATSGQTGSSSMPVAHASQLSIVPLDSAAKAFRRTTSLKIDQLCKKFPALPLADQRIEWAARSDTERERLRPLAMGIWFWQSGMTAGTLAANLTSLAQQFTALPELPADVDRAGMAQTCAAACAVLKPQAEQWQALERRLLEDLITACATEFDPARMTSMREKQKHELASAAETAHFTRQVESIREGVASEMPLLDTQTEFDMPWQTGLARMLSSYPTREDWKGSKKMSEMALKGIEQRMNARVASVSQASKSIQASYPGVFTKVVLVPAAQSAFAALKLQMEKNGQAAATDLRMLLQDYKTGTNSLKAVNHIFNGEIMGLESFIEGVNRYRPLGVADCLDSINRKASQGKLAERERKKFVAELTQLAREAIVEEFIPRITAWRDIHKMYSRIKDEVPASALPAEPKFSEMFMYPGHGVRDVLALEECIAAGDWHSEVLATSAKSHFEEFTREVASMSLTLEHGRDNPEAKAFLSDFSQLLTFSRFNNEMVSRLAGTSTSRTLKLTNKDTVAMLRNNFALAMRAFREMGTTYAYFREAAGKPSAPDAVIGTLARCAAMAEANAYLCKNLEPHVSASGSSPGEPSKVVAMEESGWVPQEIELPVVQTGTSSKPALVVEQALVPAAPLTQRLAHAREHARNGDEAFAGIARSSSQETNPFRVRDAKLLYQEAHIKLTALHAELEGMSPAQRPSGMPKPDSLMKEIVQIGLAVEIMKNLAGAQSKALFWPTADHAMQNLFAKKKNFSARLPVKFLHEFPHTDRKSGVRTIDKMIEVDIDILAHATVDGQFRSMVVQTAVLHCHYRSSLKLETRADLLQVTESDFKDVHVKPGIYRIKTQKNAPRLLTETGQESTQKVDIPYGVVPGGIALEYIKLAAKSKK